jgi:hypothetical protein
LFGRTDSSDCFFTPMAEGSIAAGPSSRQPDLFSVHSMHTTNSSAVGQPAKGDAYSPGWDRAVVETDVEVESAEMTDTLDPSPETASRSWAPSKEQPRSTTPSTSTSLDMGNTTPDMDAAAPTSDKDDSSMLPPSVMETSHESLMPQEVVEVDQVPWTDLACPLSLIRPSLVRSSDGSCSFSLTSTLESEQVLQDIVFSNSTLSEFLVFECHHLHGRVRHGSLVCGRILFQFP